MRASHKLVAAIVTATSFVMAFAFSLETLSGPKEVQAAAAAAAAAKLDKPSWLFVQLATSGSFEAISGNTNHYLLRLNGISPSMISFTDRPTRSAQLTMTKDFANEWQTSTAKDNYRENPPNGALVLSSDKFEDIFILVLEDPNYDETTQELTYKVVRVRVDNQSTAVELPTQFSQAALFIDDSWGALGG